MCSYFVEHYYCCCVTERNVNKQAPVIFYKEQNLKLCYMCTETLKIMFICVIS